MSLLGTTGQGDSLWSGSRLLICSAQTALPFPPDDADCGVIANIGDGQRSPGWAEDEFALQIVAEGSTNLTAASLYAMRLEPYTFADATFTTTHATETVNITSHGFLSGVGPVQMTNSGGALPAGYVAHGPQGQTGLYYVGVTGANTFRLYTSRAGALAADANALVSITGDGTGTHTLSDFALDGPNRTHRVVLAKVATLGDDVAGVPTVTLTAHQAYLDGPFVHQPGTIGYCVAATFSAAVAVTVSAYPRKKTQQ